MPPMPPLRRCRQMPIDGTPSWDSPPLITRRLFMLITLDAGCRYRQDTAISPAMPPSFIWCDKMIAWYVIGCHAWCHWAPRRHAWAVFRYCWYFFRAMPPSTIPLVSLRAPRCWWVWCRGEPIRWCTICRWYWHAELSVMPPFWDADVYASDSAPWLLRDYAADWCRDGWYERDITIR